MPCRNGLYPHMITELTPVTKRVSKYLWDNSDDGMEGCSSSVNQVQVPCCFLKKSLTRNDQSDRYDGSHISVATVRSLHSVAGGFVTSMHKVLSLSYNCKNVARYLINLSLRENGVEEIIE